LKEAVMTDDLISRLLDDLRNEWSDEVQSAMHALASLGHPAVQHLLDAIESRDPILRRHAALVLEQLQPQEALPPLIELLTEEEVPFESKLILVGILVDLMDSSLSSPELFSLLVTLSHESEADIRLKSVTGLGKLS
jgi:HEAT repeat protein